MDEDLDRLIDEVRLLWNALVRRGERLHEREAVTMGMRAVLEFLVRHGPTAVPAIARQRGVTRQHIQALVNPLLEAKLVEAVDNPAHRRSALLRLTAAGERTIIRMRRREGEALRGVTQGPSRGDLRRAAATLRSVREEMVTRTPRAAPKIPASRRPK